MSYDQAYWHLDSCDEKGLPEENAATHIVLFVKWCIQRDLLSNDVEIEDSDVLYQVRSGAITASEYFEKHMDWKFGEWFLNEPGNEFAANYYDQYLKDLEDSFPEAIYGAENAVEFHLVFELIDERYTEFKSLGPNNVSWKKKPWWKLW